MKRIAPIGLIALLLGCLPALPALAWGNAGHAQIAEVAWSRLDPDSRRAIVRALERHPRFQEDFAAVMPPSAARSGGRDRWIFLQASIWPDVVRRFKDHDDPALRSLHRGQWHYINKPLAPERGRRSRRRGKFDLELKRCRAAKGLNIVQALKLGLCKLENPATAPGERAVYLSWLFHLVGDMHQPLHAVSFHSNTAFRDGDRGGNGIRPEGVKSLHAAWDGLPGRTGRLDRVGSGQAASSVRALLADTSLIEAGKRAAEELAFVTWLDESRELARKDVYTAAVLDAVSASERRSPRRTTVDMPALGDAYMNHARVVARRRIVVAGFRLAALLERLPR